MRNIFQWDLNKNANIFIKENTFENLFEMAAILSVTNALKLFQMLQSNQTVPKC